MDDAILTSEQVAEILQVHPFTVLKFIKKGKLRAAKLGRVYRIRRSDVDKFIDEQVQEPAKSKSDSSNKNKKQVSRRAIINATPALLPNEEVTPKKEDKQKQEPRNEDDHYVIDIDLNPHPHDF